MVTNKPNDLPEPVYPGHPLMLALYVFKAFKNYDYAMLPGKFGYNEIQSSNEIPGAGDAVYSCCDMLRLIHDGGLEIEDAPAWADKRWKHFVQGENFGDRQAPGLEQAAEYKNRFLIEAQNWDWSTSRERTAVQLLRNLANKLDEVGESEQFKSVFTMNYTHGGRYTGPNWGSELQKAKEFLDGLN